MASLTSGHREALQGGRGDDAAKAQPRAAAKPGVARRAEKRIVKVTLRLLQPFGSHRPGETARVRPSIGAAYIRSGVAILEESTGPIGATTEARSLIGPREQGPGLTRPRVGVGRRPK